MIIRILFLMLLIPVIIVFIALLINIIPLPYFLDDSRQLLAAIIAGIISFLYLVFITIYIIYSFRRMGRIFDKTAREIDLKKQDFLYFGKKYKGNWHNREIVIEYFPPRVIQGALLNIYLFARPTILAVISKKAPLIDYKAGKKQLIEMKYGFNVYSSEYEGIRKIFSDNIFSNALYKILHKGKRGHTLQIFFRAKDIYLRSRLAHLGPEDLKTFINSLEVMAGIMENK
jgi:hypothetical protein